MTSLVLHVTILLSVALFVPEPPLQEIETYILSVPVPEEVIEEFDAIEIPAEEIEADEPKDNSSPVLDLISKIDVPGFSEKTDVCDAPTEMESAFPTDAFGLDLPNAKDFLVDLGRGKQGGGLGAAGLGAKVGFYGIEAEGRRFVFVADCSGSMSGSRLQQLKAELQKSINVLPDQAEFYIVFFNDEAIPMRSMACVQATTALKRRHLKWADTIASDGGTDPSGAIQIALTLEPTVMFLVTDGEFPFQPTLDVIRRLNVWRKVQIHTIAIGQPGAELILRRISEENRGVYRFVPN